MDAKKNAQLKLALLNEKMVIEEQLSQNNTKYVDIESSDPTDTQDEKAQTITDFEERRAVEQTLELRLKEIIDTLFKLEAGTYGFCSNCKAPIDKKRLAAMVVVKHCFTCAQRATLI